MEEVAGALSAAEEQISEALPSTPSSSDASAPQIHCGQVENSILNARAVVKDSHITVNQTTVNQYTAVLQVSQFALLPSSTQLQAITSTASHLGQQRAQQTPTPSRPTPKPRKLLRNLNGSSNDTPGTSSCASHSPPHQQASTSQRVPRSQSPSHPSTSHLQAITSNPSHLDPERAQQTPTPSGPVPKPRKLRPHLNRDTSGSSSIASRSPPQQRPASLQHTPDQMMAEAIQKLREKIKELYQPEDDVAVKIVNLPDKLVEVHPAIYLSDFYEGRVIPDDDEYDPEYRNMKLMASDKQITFDELVSNCEKHNFISIVGLPGVGKTTMSKRLARALLSHNSDNVVFRLLFKEMSDCNVKINFKKFLLGDANYSLDKNEETLAFEWIKSHPDKSFIIVDGFDQVGWSIQENAKRASCDSYDDTSAYQDLISNLCQQTIFPWCHLIFTSRPHKMLDVPKEWRPNKTLFLHDLSSDDMKTLFYDFVKGQPQPDELWKTLETNTPHLESLCRNPLMLQLYVRAVLGSSESNEHISTMTGIFYNVLQNLKLSNNAVTLKDDVVIKLAKPAYKAIQSRTVLISTDDLEGLTSEDVQDIVVTLLRSNKTCPLLEGKKQLYFIHQTVQEYFTAFYICYQMPLDEFNRFIKDDLASDHWSVVIQFLSGILFDQDKENDQNKEKRDFLLSQLIKWTHYVARPRNMHEYHVLMISKIAWESNDVEVIRKVADCFVGGWMRLDSIPLTRHDFHALSCVIERIPGRMDSLGLFGCQMNSDAFSFLRKAIKGMEGKICELDIRYNHLKNVNEITEILPKVEKTLWMENCFDDGHGGYRDANQEERQKLQQALDALENTKLKIDVGRSIPLLHKDLKQVFPCCLN